VIEPVLRLSDVTRRFRRRGRAVAAVDGVSLEALPGEIVGLVGPHGSGKTTLLCLIAGLLRPDSGSITVAGVSAGSRAARAAVGLAPEHALFPRFLSVRGAVNYCARYAGAAALAAHGLDDVADRRVARLPRGFAQRLALALAALGERRVLLLDGTLSGVDAVARGLLCDRVSELAHGGAAVLVASADLAALERVAGRVLVLARGRIVRQGPTAALLGERVLEVILDAPPRAVPSGFRVTRSGVETDLGTGSAEAALALCRAHRLAVRASRVRLRSLEDVVLDAVGGAAR